MNQPTLVKPEPYVKVCMALVALSLLTIAICQIIFILRPPPQPPMRRPVMPMEGRMMQPGQPSLPPGVSPPGQDPSPAGPTGR